MRTGAFGKHDFLLVFPKMYYRKHRVLQEAQVSRAVTGIMQNTQGCIWVHKVSFAELQHFSQF